jgi:hypothetical protein
MVNFLTVEDSLQLAAGSFNCGSIPEASRYNISGIGNQGSDRNE